MQSSTILPAAVGIAGQLLNPLLLALIAWIFKTAVDRLVRTIDTFGGRLGTLETTVATTHTRAETRLDEHDRRLDGHDRTLEAIR